MRQTFQLLSLIGLVVAAPGCSAQIPPVPPPHIVGGPCSYSSRDTVFTVLRRNAPSAAAAEAAFAGQPADLPERVRNADFIATFTLPHLPNIAVGQSFPGKIKQEISGTCTPIVYFAIIDGAAFVLEPRARPAK